MFSQFLDGETSPEALLEMSGVPEKFYCICLFDREFDDWEKGKLSGFEGLSVSPEIVNATQELTLNLKNGEEALAVFPFQETFQLNEVESIRYDDADFLVQDNFSPLKRVLNADSNGDVAFFIHRNIDSKMDFQLDSEKYEKFTGLWFRENLITEVKQKIASKQFYSIEGIVDMIQQVALNRGLQGQEDSLPPDSVLGRVVRTAIEEAADGFENESEWWVKNDPFIVPDKSVLIVGPSASHIAERLNEQYEFKFANSDVQAIELAKQVEF
jgi:hypothetical protein